MSVREAIDSILENRLADMKQQLSNALTTKAVEKLEERKVVIGQNYFGQSVNEDVEQIDELSRKTLNSYVKKTSEREFGKKDPKTGLPKDINYYDKKADKAKTSDEEDKVWNTRNRHSSGRRRARQRLKGTYHPKSQPYTAKE